MEHASGLWVAIVLFRPELLLPLLYKVCGMLLVLHSGRLRLRFCCGVLLQWLSEPSHVTAILYCPKSSKIRREVANAIYQICHHCKVQGCSKQTQLLPVMITEWNDRRDSFQRMCEGMVNNVLLLVCNDGQGTVAEICVFQDSNCAVTKRSRSHAQHLHLLPASC